MSLIEELAEFIADLTYEKLSADTVKQTKLHIFDSLGAVLAGVGTEEAKINGDLIKKMVPPIEGFGVPVLGYGFSAPLPYAVMLSCMAARLTETDDIDITSCTTPGALVVPAALLLAFDQGSNGRTFIEGVIAGYEVITRLGAAVSGPEIIYRGIWPTYLFGPIGLATVGSKILGLNSEETKHSLAISLTLSTGISGKIKGGLTSRWLTLGCAAQNGLMACMAAASGFKGDLSILDVFFPSVYGLNLEPQRLRERLGEKYQIGEVNLKPFCSARQVLASIEALQIILYKHELTPEEIEHIEVIVPQQYRQMIDKEVFPEDRLASISSIQYQLALGAFYEEDLFDVERKSLRDEKRIHRFMQKVKVKTSDEFTSIYPTKWPGKISLSVKGKKYESEVISPRGDSDQPMTWEDVEQKMKKLTHRRMDPARVETLGVLVKDLERVIKVNDLLYYFKNPDSV